MLLDELVLDGRLAKGSGLGLAPTIPVGMRAVTIRMNDIASVAGFVLPGMKVDVLVTGHPPTGDGDMTTTVLQNMLILSSGTTMQADARGQAIQAPSVTIATPDQAELLTLAGSDGKIQLVLRNSSDQGMEKTAGHVVLELYGNKRPAAKPDPTPVASKPAAAPKPVQVAVQAPPPPPVAPPPPPPDQIVMIRGTQRTVETLPSRTN